MNVQSRALLVLACAAVACADATPPPGVDNRPASVTVESGDGQRGFPRRALPDSIRVRVTDASGRPVAGARVIWVTDAESGDPAPDTSVTNSAGLAATAWTLGDIAAPALTARVEGRNLSVELSARADGFTFDCAPTAVTHNPGDLRALSCAASAVGGFSGIVSLSETPISADIHVGFGSATLDLRDSDGPVSTSAILTIGSGVPAGSYVLPLHAVSGADTATSRLTVTVR